MADTSYYIKISVDGEKKSEKKTSASTGDGWQQQANPKKKKEEGGTGLVGGAKMLMNCAAVRLVAQIGGQLIRAELNRVELRTGNARLQANQNYTINRALTYGAYTASIGIGIATANPAAMVAGVMGFVNEGVRIANAQKDLDIAKQVESVGIGMANARAGAGRKTY